MHSDSSNSQSEMAEQEVAEDSDALDGLFPVAQWYDPSERAFQGFHGFAACYSWSKRCARALDELRENLQRFEHEKHLDFVSLASVGHSYSFVTTLAALTIAQNELLTLQDNFGRITEKLAARRLLEFGDDGARSTVCGRPYPSALDGLLDVHKRVSVLVYPLGEPITSAVASAIPIVMSRTPLLVPFYAGRAEDEIVPDVGLDPHSVRTLADYPDFREAVKRAYCTTNKTRIFSEIQAFDGQAVLSNIKAELSMLSQEKLNPNLIPISAKNSSDDQTSPEKEGSKEEVRLPRCHAAALGGYLLAAQNLGGDPTDRQAYEWLNEHDDQNLPPFDNWARYLRASRKGLSMQKNERRHGRTGRSVLHQNEL